MKAGCDWGAPQETIVWRTWALGSSYCGLACGDAVDRYVLTNVYSALLFFEHGAEMLDRVLGLIPKETRGLLVHV
jgi:hypothetical protein